MNDNVSVTGIILSDMPVGDYDRRLLILTREMGKISCFAQGARRPGNRLMAVAQSMVCGTFEIRIGSNSNKLVDVSVKNFFNNIRSDGTKAFFAMYFCEVSEYMTREGSDERAMMELLYMALRALEVNKMAPLLVKAVFELKTMHIYGEGPMLSECVICHEKPDNKRFSVSYGGVIDNSCAKREALEGKVFDLRELDDSTWYALWFIEATPAGKLFSFTVNEKVQDELEKLCEDYLSIRLSHTFEGAELLKIVAK